MPIWLSLVFVTLLPTAATAAGITARSFLVADNQGQVLVEHNASRLQPIASITKLMTVVTVLHSHQDLNESLALNFRLSKQYHTRLPRSLKSLTRRELIQLALVKSDNFAAYTLCEYYAGGVQACVADMNSMARELGMHNTTFADPTGLDAKNVSTARDIMQLVLAAQVYPEVNLASNTAMVVITQARHRAEFGNTNPMVRAGEDIVVSKTGYISSSGGCLAMMINTAHGTRIVVVLGSRNTHTRVPEARQLLAKV